MSDKKRAPEYRSFMYVVAKDEMMHIHTAAHHPGRCKYLFALALPGITEDITNEMVEFIWEKIGVGEGNKIIRLNVEDGRAE